MPSPFDLTQWLSNEARDAFHAEARRKRLRQGEIVYCQGDLGEGMYRLISGAIRLSVFRADGRELLYLLFEPGDCFGMSALIDDEPLPQTAEAASDLEVEVVGRAAFGRLRAQHRSFDDALLRVVTRHMRALSTFFAEAHLKGMPARVAGRVLAAAKSFGQPAKEGICLSIPLSQSELARMVGGSRQTVNKVLQDFHQDGIISISGGRLLIHSISDLEERAARLASPPIG